MTQPVAVQRPLATGAERVPLEALVQQQPGHARVMQTLAAVWSQHHETTMRVSG